MPTLKKYIILWYDNFGENQTSPQRNGMAAIPKIGDSIKFALCLLHWASQLHINTHLKFINIIILP